MSNIQNNEQCACDWADRMEAKFPGVQTSADWLTTLMMHDPSKSPLPEDAWSVSDDAVKMGESWERSRANWPCPMFRNESKESDHA